MQLTRHQTASGLHWAMDGKALPGGLTLGAMLALPQQAMLSLLNTLAGGEPI